MGVSSEDQLRVLGVALAFFTKEAHSKHLEFLHAAGAVSLGGSVIVLRLRQSRRDA